MQQAAPKQCFFSPAKTGIMQAITFIAVLLTIITAGCGGKTDDGRTTIAVIPMGTTHEFWKSIHAGALTAANELDVDIIWKGPLKEGDRDEQIEIIETFIAAGVDAILISPMDNRALMRPVREAKERGIPTILVNSEQDGDFHSSFVATDNYNGGRILGKHMGNLLGGTGKLIALRIDEGDITTVYRARGFLDEIREHYPGIEILSDNQYAGFTVETAYTTSENLLNRYPEVTAIFTPNESATFGCLRALQDRGFAGEVTFVGFDSSVKLIQALEKNEIHGLLIQNPFRMGYEGVQIAVRLLNGEPYETRVDTGAVIATPENMSDPEVSALLTPDLSIIDGE